MLFKAGVRPRTCQGYPVGSRARGLDRTGAELLWFPPLTKAMAQPSLGRRKLCQCPDSTRVSADFASAGPKMCYLCAWHKVLPMCPVSTRAFRRLPREARCRPVVYGRFSVALRSCPGRFSVLPTHRIEPPWMADPVSVRPSWLKLSHYRSLGYPQQAGLLRYQVDLQDCLPAYCTNQSQQKGISNHVTHPLDDARTRHPGSGL